MLTSTDVGDVLAKCAAYDPMRFPQKASAIFEVWCEHFDQYPSLTRELVLEAVKIYYRTPGRNVPLPADISQIARNLWNDAFERESLDGPLHLAVEARRDALVDETPSLGWSGPGVDDEALATARRLAVERFTFRPQAERVEHCRFGCGALHRREGRGPWLHPDGTVHCPQAPREAAELSQDGLEAPPEGGGTGEAPADAEEVVKK